MRAMDYAEVREAFFQLRDAGAPEPGTSGWQSPTRRLRDAIEPIATICYWSEPSYDAYAALGLDFLQGYVWSRGCVLGEPDGSVVAAAFGVFEPGLIGQLYDAARATAGLADIRAARETGAVTALRAVLGAPEQVAEVTGALRRAAEAADTAGPCSPAWPGCPGRPTSWASSGTPARSCGNCAATAISPRAWPPG